MSMKQSSYLRVRISHFRENFINEVVAKCASAFTFRNRQKRHVPAEAILFAELVWLDFSDLGKEKSCIGVHHLKTLQRQKEFMETTGLKTTAVQGVYLEHVAFGEAI